MNHMTRLYQIREEVHRRCDDITSAQPNWPCRKGCDDCCRSLASMPRVAEAEWKLIAAAIDRLPAGITNSALKRIEESANASRPITCPLLDTASGACLIYEARPMACRAYGFYAERQYVLGCSRIEAIGEQSPDIVWGNHPMLEAQLDAMGPAATLPEWLRSAASSSHATLRTDGSPGE